MRFLLRPIYRAFFKRPLRWGLIKLRTLFLADVIARLQRIEQLSVQLHHAEANLAGQLHNLRAELVPYLQRAETKNSELHAHSQILEANNTAQWDAIEQLLLALFRVPEPRNLDLDVDIKASGETSLSRAFEVNRVHASSDLR